MDARIQQISATAFSHPAPWGLFLNQNNLTTFEQTVFLPLMRSMLQVGQAAGEFPRLSLRGGFFPCSRNFPAAETVRTVYGVGEGERYEQQRTGSGRFQVLRCKLSLVLERQSRTLAPVS